MWIGIILAKISIVIPVMLKKGWISINCFDTYLAKEFYIPVKDPFSYKYLVGGIYYSKKYVAWNTF